ncbi:MAG: hypothetical protein JSS97_08035, partial [Actinobacteria bacterium]|nr:hypothetical protein [Actinomycetota bacterium]
GEIADLGDADAFDDAIDIVGTWSREDKRAGTKTMLQALIDKRIGRRDQAQAWVWRLAGYTRELHEEYAVQRWPETKRLLGLLVNSSGRAHGRNARRLVHAARKQDRRLAVALLAAAVSHTPEGEEVLRGARMRMARKPSAVARELLRNFPKGGKRRRKRNKRGNGNGGGEGENGENGAVAEAVQSGAEAVESGAAVEMEASSNGGAPEADGEAAAKPKRSRRRKAKAADDEDGESAEAVPEPEPEEKPKRARRRKATKAAKDGDAEVEAEAPEEGAEPKPKRKPAKRKAAKDKGDADKGDAEKPKRKRKAKPKAAKAKAAAAASEAGQMHIAGAEGDAVPVGESDD